MICLFSNNWIYDGMVYLLEWDLDPIIKRLKHPPDVAPLLNHRLCLSMAVIIVVLNAHTWVSVMIPFFSSSSMHSPFHLHYSQAVRMEILGQSQL